MTADTIVALATPPGRGGIAVVRLSGPDAFAIALRLVERPVELVPRRAVLARIAVPALGPISNSGPPQITKSTKSTHPPINHQINN